METSSGSHFNHHRSPAMLPPRRGQISSDERGLNFDQVRESPSESASSRDTWPLAEHSVTRHISTSDKMSLHDIARERINTLAERIQNVSDEYLEKLKFDLRGLLEGSVNSQQREEFLYLQKLVRSRGDLNEKTLVMAHRIQLEILVCMKTGIQAFLHPSVSLSQSSLIDIFLYKKCRNIACGSVLPGENCTCSICSKRNGFCSLCMCVICNKFDFEVNTCRWVGCDLCSHWTHTECAIRNGQIVMGPTEMIFKCEACYRTSELLGWVKDVFQHCSPSWDREALIKELDYVSRIFHGSEDPKGRKLLWKCEELIGKLRAGVTEPMLSKPILILFQELELDGLKSEESEEIGPQEAFNKIGVVVQEAIKKMEMVSEEKIRMVKKARIAVEVCDEELKDKVAEVSALKIDRQRKKQQIDELESIVRLKQAEAEMFELKANEARREKERLQRIALAKKEKSETEEDYASRYLKQRLSEAEAEKQFLFQKIKLQENSNGNGNGNHMMMYSNIQHLLKNMCNLPSKTDG